MKMQPLYTICHPTKLAGLFLAGSLLAGCASAPMAASVNDTAQPVAEAQTERITVSQKLNINTAMAEDFLAIPNVGEKMTDEFMEYRPFLSIAQFRQDMSKYVDDAQIAEYEKYLFVPIGPNDADSATLQQLPGVDETAADTLMAGRPYASEEAFMETLATLVTPEQAIDAAVYLGTGELAIVDIDTMAHTEKLNVNTATESEFLAIPNVGENMVDEFMEYRPFLSIAQFRQDIGKYVDEAQLAEYEKHLFVPVDPNNADSATLQQLPDVDESLAADLIAGRPYVSHEAFLDVLSQHLSANELADVSLFLEAK